MKFLFCQECNDLIRPRKGSAGPPRTCFCQRYAAWFEDDGVIMSVFDRDPHRPSGARAMVIAISNALFRDPNCAQTGAQIAALLAGEQDGDRFKAEGSLILCAPPGVSPRTRWADSLPQVSQTAFIMKY